MTNEQMMVVVVKVQVEQSTKFNYGHVQIWSKFC